MAMKHLGSKTDYPDEPFCPYRLVIVQHRYAKPCLHKENRLGECHPLDCPIKKDEDDEVE